VGAAFIKKTFSGIKERPSQASMISPTTFSGIKERPSQASMISPTTLLRHELP
jgi:hypothetical protein